MSMKDWARNEVNKVIDDSIEDDFYYVECCKSALKAYECLTEDGHSGMSIGITKSILMRLIDGNPLTPIEDIPEVWDNVTLLNDDNTTYQCNRQYSLFKDVYPNGEIIYTDIDRVKCHNINNKNTSYTSRLVTNIINEMFPITLPYYPGISFKAGCEDFLTDDKNGDFDTVGILYVILPEGEKIEINRFFHFVDGTKDVEIPKSMYDDLKMLAKKREAKLSTNI